MLAQYQQEFIALAIQRQALRFGEFTLKSGRVSPYFFNAGAFSSGAAVGALGRCYARTIVDLGVEFDILFGPAYKGIPLVTATAIALADHFQRDVPYCFNRKEAKTHGEGGVIVGGPLAGRVLVVDDVITAGTAIRGALELVGQSGAEAAGIVVGLDRRERGRRSQSAIQELESSAGVSVTSVVDIEDILVYIRQNNADEALLARIERYQAEFGV